jgi:hypothetical protein
MTEAAGKTLEYELPEKEAGSALESYDEEWSSILSSQVILRSAQCLCPTDHLY